MLVLGNLEIGLTHQANRSVLTRELDWENQLTVGIEQHLSTIRQYHLIILTTGCGDGLRCILAIHNMHLREVCLVLTQQDAVIRLFIIDGLHIIILIAYHDGLGSIIGLESQHLVFLFPSPVTHEENNKHHGSYRRYSIEHIAEKHSFCRRMTTYILIRTETLPFPLHIELSHLMFHASLTISQNRTGLSSIILVLQQGIYLCRTFLFKPVELINQRV